MGEKELLEIKNTIEEIKKIKLLVDRWSRGIVPEWEVRKL